MNIIFGYCFTNEDGFEIETWPTSFVAVPRNGEYVKSKSDKSLKVCRVTHIGTGGRRYHDEVNATPLIEVELTK